MKEIIVKRLGALLSVKSLVTLLLSGVFASPLPGRRAKSL